VERSDVEAERITFLNRQKRSKGAYVLYWMQQSQRSELNHALEYAAHRANSLRQPLVVVFGLTGDYPEANLRHYTFMLEGLEETGASLQARGIKLVVMHASPPDAALAAASEASFLVCDRGYMRHQALWRAAVAAAAPCPVVQVEADAIVPVETASSKAEYAARTLRPRVHTHARSFLTEPAPVELRKSSLDADLNGMDVTDTARVLRKLRADRSVPSVTRYYRGGTSRAKELFETFLRNDIDRYTEDRSQPHAGAVSHMSMYLHFGQISPVYLALRLGEVGRERDTQKAAFLEQLLVRRELALNFVHHTRNYDSYECLPRWARETLARHRKDRREFRYGRQELENLLTHDEYWNAAMTEMKFTGYMHNHMRMYWGKKILEWSETPEEAFQTILALNNKYFLDGRDPNSYAGAGWVLGLHDRPWKERPIFGTVRYMAASGLERKCDIKGYVEEMKRLRAGATQPRATAG